MTNSVETRQLQFPSVPHSSFTAEDVLSVLSILTSAVNRGEKS